MSEIDIATGTAVDVLEGVSIDNPEAIAISGPDVWVESRSGGALGTGSLTEFSSVTGLVTDVINESANDSPEGMAVIGGVLLEINGTTVSEPCDGEFTCNAQGPAVVTEYNSATGAAMASTVHIPNASSILGGPELLALYQNGLGAGMGAVSEISPATGKVTQTLLCPGVNELPYGATSTNGQTWVACQTLGFPALVGPNWFSLKSKYKLS